jgi:hypothetical protein
MILFCYGLKIKGLEQRVEEYQYICSHTFLTRFRDIFAMKHNDTYINCGKELLMKCPGQDTRYWKPGDIFDVECPHCGNTVEFFKDEVTRLCKGCKNKIVNPRMDFGCAGYCQFAEQCLGSLGPELLLKRDDFFKDRLAIYVKSRLGRDFKKIAHITNVARYAEEVSIEEKSVPALAICAAYLHVFCESQAEEEIIAGRETAINILEHLGARQELTDKVLDIIDRFIAGETGDSLDAKVFFDAHLLAVYEEKSRAHHEMESDETEDI